jgi:hypothetical protein
MPAATARVQGVAQQEDWREAAQQSQRLLDVIANGGHELQQQEEEGEESGMQE